MDGNVLEFLGVDPGMFAAVLAVVYFVIEGLKGKFAGLTGGWKTNLIGLLVAIGAAAIAYVGPEALPSWAQIVTLGMIVWLAPAGVSNMVKNLKS